MLAALASASEKSKQLLEYRKEDFPFGNSIEPVHRALAEAQHGRGARLRGVAHQVEPLVVAPVLERDALARGAVVAQHAVELLGPHLSPRNQRFSPRRPLTAGAAGAAQEQSK